MSENIKAIVNKRKVKKLNYSSKMLLITLNMVLLGVVANFIYIIGDLEENKLRNPHMQEMLQMDASLLEKFKLLMGMFSFIAAVVLIAGIILLIILGLFWIKKVKGEYNMYRFLGYKRKAVKKLILLDNMVEYILSVPIVAFLSVIVWKFMISNELIKELFEGTSGWENINPLLFIIVMAAVLVVAAVESVM